MDRTKLLVIAGYNTFFWMCFWLFCYWTFPYQRVAAFLTDKVAESGAGYTLEIGELAPHWISGVELKDVKIRKVPPPGSVPPPAPDLKDKAKGAPVDDAIRVREARARIGILGLLFGNKSLSFDALFDEGEIEGAYEEDGDTKHVEGKLDKIDLARLGIADALLSLPAKGTLEGEFDLSVGKEASDTRGTATLLLKQLTVGDGQAKLKMAGMGGLTIDPIEAGDVTLELDVKSGVGEIKKLTTNGRDIELNGSGEIRFANPFARSRLDLLLTIKFTDAYKNKTPRTKAMFALLDGSAMPQVRSATTPDGALAYRITGLVATPRALPAGRSAPRNGGPRNTPAKPAGGSRPDDDAE